MIEISPNLGGGLDNGHKIFLKIDILCIILNFLIKMFFRNHKKIDACFY